MEVHSVLQARIALGIGTGLPLMDAPRESMPSAQQAEQPLPHLLDANHNKRWSRAARIAPTFSLDHSMSTAIGD